MANKAKESKQIQKARAKLVQQLDKESEQVTPEAIEKTAAQIQGWIARHASERISLQDKDIALFDENSHPANTSSQHVKALRRRLLEESGKEETTIADLRGRVKRPETQTPERKESAEAKRLDDVMEDLHDVQNEFVERTENGQWT